MYIRLAIKNPNYILTDPTLPYFTLPTQLLGSMSEPDFVNKCGIQYMSDLFLYDDRLGFTDLFTDNISGDLSYDKYDIFNASFRVDFDDYKKLNKGYENWTQSNFENCNYLVIYNTDEGASGGGTSDFKWYNVKYYWITKMKYDTTSQIEYTLMLDEYCTEYWKKYVEQITTNKIKGIIEVKQLHRNRFKKTYINDNLYIDYNYDLNSDVFIDDANVSDYKNKTFTEQETTYKLWTKYLEPFKDHRNYVDCFGIRNKNWNPGSPDYTIGNTWFLYGIVKINHKDSVIPPFNRESDSSTETQPKTDLPLPFYCIPLTYDGVQPKFDAPVDYSKNIYTKWVKNGGDDGLLSHIILVDNPLWNMAQSPTLPTKEITLGSEKVQALAIQNYQDIGVMGTEVIKNDSFFDFLKIDKTKLDFTKIRDYNIEPKLYMDLHFTIEMSKLGQKPYTINVELLMRNETYLTLTDRSKQDSGFQLIQQAIFTPSLQTFYYTPNLGYYKNSCNYTFKNSKIVSTDGSVMMWSDAYVNYMNGSKNTFNNNYLNAQWQNTESYFNPMNWLRFLWNSRGLPFDGSGQFSGHAFDQATRKLDAQINDLENTPNKLTNTNSNDAYNYLSMSLVNVGVTGGIKDFTSVLSKMTIPENQRILVSNHYNLFGYILNRQINITNYIDLKNLFENRTRFNWVNIYNIMSCFNKENIPTQIVEKINQRFNQGVRLFMPLPELDHLPNPPTDWSKIALKWDINNYDYENVEYDIWLEINKTFTISSKKGTITWTKKP